MKKPILCLDFDGVLHSYTSGWKGAAVIPDPPTDGAIDFLVQVVDHFDVQIFSSRSGQPGGKAAMRLWLHSHIFRYFDCHFAGDPKDFDRATALYESLGFPTEKPAAMITIDDRALTFDGTWPSIHKLKDFRPWNKR